MNEENKSVGFFGGAVSVADATDIAAKINESAQQDPRGAIGDSDYLNFSGKKGVYTIGQEARKIQPDERWIVNVTSFEDGWMCWKGGRPAATRMANIFSGVPVPQPDFNEFGPFDEQRGEGWFQAKGMTLKSIDEDQQGYFKINSKSGVSAIAGLQRLVADRIANDMPKWPVIRLDEESFTSNGFTNSKPVFVEETWLTDEQMMAIGDGAELESVMDAPAQVEDKTEKTGRRRKL